MWIYSGGEASGIPSSKQHRGESADKPYECRICGKSYVSINSRNKHEKRTHGEKESHMCRFCGKTFTREDNHMRHQKICDENPDIVIGRGISQRFYDETLQVDDTMRLMKKVHEGNYREFTKNLFPKKNFYAQLRSCIIYDCREILKTEQLNLKFSICAILTEPPIFFKLAQCQPVILR